MRELTTEELKHVELNILKNVAAFCDKNNIRYYLGGGTLLGAVRHKGFIPWDDDIDISMPRPDYLRFVKTYNGHCENYYVKSIEIDEKYWRTFAKVFDGRTVLEEEFTHLPTEGNAVFIDIFPIDGIPSFYIKQRLLFKQQEFLNVLYRGSAWRYIKSKKYRDSVNEHAEIYGLLRTVMKFIAITLFRVLPTHDLIRLINKNAGHTSYENAEYIGAIVDCTHGAACEMMEKKLFEPRILFDFEDTQFWGPKGYDTYLKNLYGNYMELPPIHSRTTHHDFKAYWKNI